MIINYLNRFTIIIIFTCLISCSESDPVNEVRENDITENESVIEEGDSFNLPQTNEWVTLNPMTSYRYDAGFELYENKIYALGGFAWSGSSENQSGEIFDLETGSWKFSEPLLKESEGVTSELVDKKIYLIGGRLADSKVQIYDCLLYTSDAADE